MSIFGGRRRGRFRAFSMAELLVAVGLLGVVIVSVMGLFLMLMNGSSKGLAKTIALDIAQNELDYCAGSTPAKWLALNGGTIGETEAHALTDQRANTTFYWVMTPTELSNSTTVNSPATAPFDLSQNTRTNAMGDIYRLDMDVYWWPDQINAGTVNTTSISTRQGFGKQDIHMSRFVYVENMKQ